VFALSPSDYYMKSISTIRAGQDEPHFFVFSDDRGWAKANIVTTAPITYIEHNTPAHPHEDLRLMSNCKHFIIANSTFSWWAAWLSTHKSKTVIAPMKWFNNASRQKKWATSRMLPSAWMQL